MQCFIRFNSKVPASVALARSVRCDLLSQELLEGRLAHPWSDHIFSNHVDESEVQLELLRPQLIHFPRGLMISDRGVVEVQWHLSSQQLETLQTGGINGH
eukprot:s1922_g6.t1